jgi:hypothetical protein
MVMSITGVSFDPVILAPWVALVITVAGWVTSHWLSLRAQRMNLLAQTLNSARLEASTRIREFQSWCTAANPMVSRLGFYLDADNPNDLRMVGDIREARMLLLTDTRTYMWIRVLEEYEALFPQFIPCRIELLKLARNLVDGLTEFCDSIAHARPIPKLTARAQSLTESIFDLLALSEDLRIHLQNVTLAQISGAKAKLRVPEKFRHVQVLCDERGEYHVFGGHGTS